MMLIEPMMDEAPRMCIAKMPASMDGPICSVSGAYSVQPRSRGAAGHEEGTHQHQRRRNHQPEAEVVHARKRHVGGADLQRNHPVRKTHEGRHDGAEHHDQAVHGGELVEQLGVDQLQAGLEQLGADQQRQHAANHQHGEAEQQVQRADVLVVGGKHPAAPARRGMVIVGVMRVIVDGLELHSSWLPLVALPVALSLGLTTMGRQLVISVGRLTCAQPALRRAERSGRSCWTSCSWCR